MSPARSKAGKDVRKAGAMRGGPRGSGARRKGRGRGAAGGARRRKSAKGAGSAKGKSRAKGAGGRREGATGALTWTLALLALLVAAAVFPMEWLGPRIMALFPTGNPMGTAGQALREFLVAWVGVGCAAVPVGLLAGAGSAGPWGSAQGRRGMWILALALAVLLPLGGFLVAGEGAAGALGAAIGEPLERTLGLGAWVLLGGGVVATSIAAFRFNPLRPPRAAALAAWQGLRWGARKTGSGARRVGEAHRSWRVRRTEKAGRKAAQAGGGAAEIGGESGATDAPPAAVAGAPPGGDAAGGEEPAAAADHRGADPADHHRPAEAAAIAADGDRSLRGAGAAAADPTPSAGQPAPNPDAPALPLGPLIPPVHLLTSPVYANRAGMEQELDRLGGVLTRTLATFNIKCTISGRTTGPAVTQYEVVPAAGVKVNRIANLEADLALAMRARSIRIVAPIPGKGAVGVEIPNPHPEMVRLREILESAAFAHAKGALPLAMGKDLEGRPYVADLAQMPHALIAGATGSGKSVCLNTVITSLACRHGPDRLRLLMIDPKMVELSAYADLPHLRHPVVTDPREAAGVLKWAVMEMERRYALLSANGVRSLKEFNQRVDQGVDLKLAAADGPEEEPKSWLYQGGTLPWIVIVVDELADLMMTVQADVEKPLTQLAQKARAIGIHLLVATQRPSVNVITGLIKANFPCRIAFRVASKTDSRTILDQNGADSLLGHGDMLFLPPGRSEPVRMQGAFVSTEETEALMAWYREQADTPEALKARVKRADQDILEQVRAQEAEVDEGSGGASWGDWDPLFREAALACIQQGAGSTSLLQRRLRIGYGRAARIVDQLHDAGVLGPPDGSKPREVLVGSESLEEICPA